RRASPSWLSKYPSGNNLFHKVRRIRYRGRELVEILACAGGGGYFACRVCNSEPQYLAAAMVAAALLRALDCLWRRAGFCADVVAIFVLQPPLRTAITSGHRSILSGDTLLPGYSSAVPPLESGRSVYGFCPAGFEQRPDLACAAGLLKRSDCELPHQNWVREVISERAGSVTTIFHSADVHRRPRRRAAGRRHSARACDSGRQSRRSQAVGEGRDVATRVAGPEPLR